MIKANELRTGNLVLFNGKVVKISEVGRLTIEVEINELKYLYCKIEDLKPIPLTEEWLLKFGWGKGEYDTEYVDNVSLKQECLSYNVGAKMFCIETNGDIMEIKHIRYVHQLQNIFYCLTGQELELK